MTGRREEEKERNEGAAVHSAHSVAAPGLMSASTDAFGASVASALATAAVASTSDLDVSRALDAMSSCSCSSASSSFAAAAACSGDGDGAGSGGGAGATGAAPPAAEDEAEATLLREELSLAPAPPALGRASPVERLEPGAGCSEELAATGTTAVAAVGATALAAAAAAGATGCSVVSSSRVNTTAGGLATRLNAPPRVPPIELFGTPLGLNEGCGASGEDKGVASGSAVSGNARGSAG